MALEIASADVHDATEARDAPSPAVAEMLLRLLHRLSRFSACKKTAQISSSLSALFPALARPLMRMWLPLCKTFDALSVIQPSACQLLRQRSWITKTLYSGLHALAALPENQIFQRGQKKGGDWVVLLASPTSRFRSPSSVSSANLGRKSNDTVPERCFHWSMLTDQPLRFAYGGACSHHHRQAIFSVKKQAGRQAAGRHHSGGAQRLEQDQPLPPRDS